MLVDVVMPKMGESIQEGKILRWTKSVGDVIRKDETILEISTDKVDSEIPSSVSGVLAKILAGEQEVVPVGAVIAVIETDASVKIDLSALPAVRDTRTPASAVPSDRGTMPSMDVRMQDAPVRRQAGGGFLSPLVRAIARKEGITAADLNRIAGSGSNGRVTKQDVLAFLDARGRSGLPAAAPKKDYNPQRLVTAEVVKKYPAPDFRVVPMDNVQTKMAEHMLRSVATSPHVTAIDEVDVSAIVSFRSTHAARFEQREGFKLTFTPFFADAVVRALKEFPIVNASIEGDHVVYKNFIHLGIAVASPTGLIVPNVRHAEEKDLLGIARAINDIAVRTRIKKLMPDELAGGTFSITNYGVFGNIIGTPIINQPQVAILGVGAIKKRPVVLPDETERDAIAIRSMVYLTLAFDHRIIDGAIGGQFLARVKSYLEQFEPNGAL